MARYKCINIKTSTCHHKSLHQLLCKLYTFDVSKRAICPNSSRVPKSSASHTEHIDIKLYLNFPEEYKSNQCFPTHVLEQDFKIYRAQPVPNRETHEVELWAGPWQREGSVEYTISYEYLMRLGKKERLNLRNYDYDHFINVLRIECC